MRHDQPVQAVQKLLRDLDVARVRLSERVGGFEDDLVGLSFRAVTVGSEVAPRSRVVGIHRGQLTTLTELPVFGASTMRPDPTNMAT